MSTDLYDVHDISVEPDITGQDSKEEESVEPNIPGQDSMEEESVESDITGQDSMEEEFVESDNTGQDSMKEESVEPDVPGQESLKEESVEPDITGQESMKEESVEPDITGQESMEEDDGKTRSICRKKKTQRTRRKAKLLNTRAKKIDRTPCVICKTQYFKSTVNWFICSACTKWSCANCTEKKRSKKPICKRCYKPWKHFVNFFVMNYDDIFYWSQSVLNSVCQSQPKILSFQIMAFVIAL